MRIDSLVDVYSAALYQLGNIGKLNTERELIVKIILLRSKKSLLNS